ncbi:MAG TPA: response regulator transcription factor [Bacteroidales bacterium]|nr:response regulator transcription factor [Bacteroidales bacterium]
MIRIVIADDHPLIRGGLRKIIEQEIDMDLTAEYENAQLLIHQLLPDQCDVLILDLSLPDRNGLDVLQHIHTMWPHIKVLILSMHPEERYALRALKKGASGYIHKNETSVILIKAIRKVFTGGRYVSEQLAEKLASEYAIETTVALHDKLTGREFQILVMIAQGLSVRQISRILSLSPNTIYTLRSRLLQKMDMTSNAELIRYALDHDLVD